MEENWIYAGVFFSFQERMKLIMNVGKYVPEGWITHASHSTVVFNDGNDAGKPWYEWALEHEGEEKTLEITHVGKSDRALAVRADGMTTRNSIPHITIAVSPVGKPVDSNFIEEWKPLDEPFRITGKVKVIRKK